MKPAVCLAAALLASSCARPAIKLPSGPGEPATDGRAVLSQATASCAAIRTFTAEVRLTGKIQGQPIRARLLVGTAAPASARVEVVAPIGAPVFIFTARGDDATLLMPRDLRVLEHGRPDEILAAIAGVPLNAEALRETLTGCAPADPDVGAARQFGQDWRVVEVNGSDAIITLHRDPAGGAWRLVAIERRDERGGRRWQAVYSDVQNNVPLTVRLASLGAAPRDAFDLQLSLSQIDTNVPLDADAFRVTIPSGATPISLDELRHARPGVREN